MMKLAFAFVLVAAPAMGATCESLSTFTQPHVQVTLAQTVAAGQFALPNARGGGRGANAFASLPAFCRVAATLTPSSDSDIKIEVWLPASGWNGKLEANGNGGWSGSISAATLSAGLLRGYATAMSDLGHEGSSASFAMDHPEKLIDFGYRSVHETTAVRRAAGRR